MNLRQINELWNEYKEKYDLPKDVQISAVQYDAEKYVEGFFNILELLAFFELPQVVFVSVADSSFLAQALF